MAVCMRGYNDSFLLDIPSMVGSNQHSNDAVSVNSLQRNNLGQARRPSRIRYCHASPGFLICATAADFGN